MKPLYQGIIDIVYAGTCPHFKEDEYFLWWYSNIQYYPKNVDWDNNIFPAQSDSQLYPKMESSQYFLRYSKTWDRLEFFRERYIKTMKDGKFQHYQVKDALFVVKNGDQFLCTHDKHIKRYLSILTAPLFHNHFFSILGREDKEAIIRLYFSHLGPLGLHCYENKLAYSNKALRKATALDELVTYTAGTNISPRMKALFPDNLVDLAKLYSLLRKNQIPKFNQLLYKNYSPELVGSEERWPYQDSFMHQLVNIIYKDHEFVIRGNTRYSRYNIIRDYLQMTLATGRKINLNWGLRRILEEHDAWSLQIRLKANKNISKIKTAKHFKVLSSTEDYQVELINKKERLIQEGAEMSHCVASYAQSINAGGCAIYSINYLGMNYTLELGKRDGLYRINQMKGKYNSQTPIELFGLLNKQLLLINSKLLKSIIL